MDARNSKRIHGLAPVVNLHEIAARQKKVAALVDILIRAKLSYAEVLLAKPGDWERAAQAARVKPPSDETVRLVLETLKSLEEPLPKG